MAPSALLPARGRPPEEDRGPERRREAKDLGEELKPGEERGETDGESSVEEETCITYSVSSKSQELTSISERVRLLRTRWRGAGEGAVMEEQRESLGRPLS